MALKNSRKFKIASKFKPSGDQPAAIQQLVSGLTTGIAAQTLLGVTGSGKTFTIAHVIEQVQRPTLVLAPNKTLAAQLYGELKTFFPHNAVEYFVSYYDYYQPEAYVPSKDLYIEKDAAINEQVERMRLSATKSLFERADVIIVATVSAIYGLGDPSAYVEMVLELKCGAVFEQRKLLRRLAELQYTRNDIDFRRATYRVRGDVIDIFPAEAEAEGIRIELFGDEIERISQFDPLTGKVLQQLQHVAIYPKSHYVTPRQRVLDAIEEIKQALKERLAELNTARKLVEAQRLEQRTLYDLEMMQELGYCSGIENYSRYLSSRSSGEPPPTLIEYLPDNALLVIDESHVTIPQLGGMYRGDRARKENLVNYGFRLPSALDNRPLKFEEFVQMQPQTIYVSATPGDYELQKSPGMIVEQVVRPTGLVDPQVVVRPAASQVDDVLSEINRRVAANERVLITTLTKRMAEDLTDYLAEHGIKVRYLHSDVETMERIEIIRDLRLGTFNVLVGINLLREGLDLPEVSLVAVFDADKEGFLRSERSLIQTIGRAARNINGTAILYADVVTGSMQRAIAETERRRAKQMAYNKQHNIIPAGIVKAIVDVMVPTKITTAATSKTKLTAKQSALNSLVANYANAANTVNVASDPKQLADQILQLEQQMYQHANNLEFEQAAELRDQIRVLTELFQKS